MHEDIERWAAREDSGCHVASRMAIHAVARRLRACLSLLSSPPAGTGGGVLHPWGYLELASWRVACPSVAEMYVECAVGGKSGDVCLTVAMDELLRGVG